MQALHWVLARHCSTGHGTFILAHMSYAHSNARCMARTSFYWITSLFFLKYKFTRQVKKGKEDTLGSSVQLSLLRPVYMFLSWSFPLKCLFFLFSSCPDWAESAYLTSKPFPQRFLLTRDICLAVAHENGCKIRNKTTHSFFAVKR